VISLNSESRAFTGGRDRIQTPCIISRNENSVTMPPLSTSMIHCFRTSSCLVANASSNTQHQYPHPYTPFPPLSSSIPICTGDSGNSCFALLLLFTSSFSRVALPPTSFFLSLQRSSASLLLCVILKAVRLTLSPPCCWQTARPAGPFCEWCGRSRGFCLRSRRWRFLRLWC
jgi:hypothetical protein